MPLRNLMLITLTAIVSLACYEKASHSRYVSMLTDVMGVVERHYLEPVERRELFDHAMHGMISGLDPYSGYMPASEYKQFLEGIEQKFGGIGILVEINPLTRRLTVMSPLFGTPAYEAGILSGDTIMSIDGRDTEGLDLRAAVKLMKGDPETPVKLGVLHRGEDEVVELTIVRKIIRTESVLGDRRIEGARWDYRLQEDPRIAYLRLENFGDQTADEVAQALSGPDGKFGDYQAIIIDLRGNPGGTLAGAVRISDLFLDRGVIVTTRGRGGAEDETYPARAATLVPPHVPVVVLVNQYSASASEIVAAALQDHGRAKIIGQRTWGKGTVQNLLPLDNGHSGALRLTTSSYWRPSGANIHRKKDATDDDQWGVSPSEGFEVKLTDDELTKVLEARAARDVYRPYDETPKTSDPPPDEIPQPVPDDLTGATPDGESPPAAADASNSDDAKPDDAKADDAKANDAPFDDPQMRKAIEYLQQKIGPPTATASASR